MAQDIKNLALYTFSALLQADAAVFGLFAVFLVYQMQTLGNNQRNSLDVASSQYPQLKGAATELMLPIALEEVHSILFTWKSSPSYAHLLTIAFTDYWKQAYLKFSRPVFLLLILQAEISSAGLLYANDLDVAVGLSPNARIILGLMSFLMLLVIISFAGYRTLSRHTTTAIPPIPSIDIQSISLEDFQTCVPARRDFGHLFSIRHYERSRLIKLLPNDNNTVTIACMARNDKGDFVSAHIAERLPRTELESYLNNLRLDVDKYWTLSK